MPVSKSFNGRLLIEVLVIVVGIAMVLKMTSLDSDQDEHRVETIANRVAICRVMAALGQPLDKDGPCAEPLIVEEMKKYKVIVVGGREEQMLISQILCEQQHVPSCEKVLPHEEDG